MKIAFVIAFIGLAVGCRAQSPDGAQIFSSAQLHGQLNILAQQAAKAGSSSIALGDYGSHTIMLSERTVSGGAEIHAHFDDVMIVMSGKATLISGGRLIDAHSSSNGESSGSGIRDGVTRAIAAGDIVHVPAGTPHQLLIDRGTPYSALVVKIRE
jgi:mannose-6-phosphate isomerase-like protein (cupin superfamily)